MERTVSPIEADGADTPRGSSCWLGRSCPGTTGSPGTFVGNPSGGCLFSQCCIAARFSGRLLRIYPVTADECRGERDARLYKRVCVPIAGAHRKHSHARLLLY